MALLGSGEFLPWARTVDTWLAERSTVTSDRVLVIPAASAPEGADVFERWSSMGLAHYREIGLSPEVSPLRTREDAEDPSCVDQVHGARLLFFSGGNPGYLAEILRGTAFWRAVLDAVAEGTSYGGCSAGAMAPASLAPVVRNEVLEGWVPGLGMLPGAFVIPHFDMMDTYVGPGFRDQMIEMCPAGSQVVGIDEDTALYGSDGEWTVTGAGSVWIGPPGDLTQVAPGESSDARLGVPLE